MIQYLNADLEYIHVFEIYPYKNANLKFSIQYPIIHVRLDVVQVHVEPLLQPHLLYSANVPVFCALLDKYGSVCCVESKPHHC